MLVVAATADAEIGTGRSYAIRRRGDHACQTAADEFLVALQRLDRDKLIAQDEGYEDGVALVMPQAIAAVYHFLYA